ncbi:methyl-accepting chemotaxis protein [Vibrio maerlii]|uniref:methyl-accepting chemotaxis protein n=1 Tax=Vibrio maerlii TaxID=2231648 RepID=UPI000E3D19BB|nr:methyl-accepting chemotaxis protein [Vibrio maerlii]
MNLLNSIAKKLVLAIATILVIISAIVSYFAVSQRAESVEAEVLQHVELETGQTASTIREFFRERSRVVTTLAETPFLNDWFADYTERGSYIEDDAEYQSIVKMFAGVSQHDPLIKSVFYAPANTFEYFDINGRYNDANYYTNKRPWWFEALEIDRLFITEPQIDANDKSIVTSIKTTVKTNQGKLVGVLGIDILGTEIKEKLIDKMAYQGQGTGFLITSEGQIIALNDRQNMIDMSKLPTLDQVDRIVPNSSGFSELLNQAQRSDTLSGSVVFNGVEQEVFVQSIKDTTMNLDWRIGFMVPESMISGPVKATLWGTLGFIVTMVVITCVILMALINLVLTKPMNKVVSAMDDIATGEGDLTQRLDYAHNDELGRLSDSFNTFVDNIQTTIRLSLSATNQVATGSDELQKVVGSFGTTVSGQKSFIEQIATASTEMSQTINGIADSAQTAQCYSEDATARAQEGKEVVDQATQLMNALYEDVSKTEQDVTVLHENVTAISNVLGVIKGVAEQTNLLALNAAIEAARAGEQGRGFAVVADEVRTLAQRTQESTVNIESIIDRLQTSASETVESMKVGRDKAEQGVVMIADVDQKLNDIREAAELIKTQSQEIASMVKEQAIASEDITQQTVSVDQLAEESVTSTAEMENKIQQQVRVIDSLNETISKFKVS